MLILNEVLNGLRKLIRDNVFDGGSASGFFVFEEREYLACLELNERKLKELLKRDEELWVQNINFSKGIDAAKIAEARDLIEEQNQKFASMLSQQKVSKGNPKPKFSLRKLPFWGQSNPHRLDFEWPTQALLDQMPASASLHSLEFKSSFSGPIASVRVNLTHGFSSRVFEKQDGQFQSRQTITFDVKRPIKKVQGADQNGTLPCLYRVKFMDKEEKQVSMYDPSTSIGLYAGQVHPLRENEELIGVYGKLE